MILALVMVFAARQSAAAADNEAVKAVGSQRIKVEDSNQHEVYTIDGNNTSICDLALSSSARRMSSRFYYEETRGSIRRSGEPMTVEGTRSEPTILTCVCVHAAFIVNTLSAGSGLYIGGNIFLNLPLALLASTYLQCGTNTVSLTPKPNVWRRQGGGQPSLR